MMLLDLCTVGRKSSANDLGGLSSRSFALLSQPTVQLDQTSLVYVCLPEELCLVRRDDDEDGEIDIETN